MVPCMYTPYHGIAAGMEISNHPHTSLDAAMKPMRRASTRTSGCAGPHSVEPDVDITARKGGRHGGGRGPMTDPILSLVPFHGIPWLLTLQRCRMLAGSGHSNKAASVTLAAVCGTLLVDGGDDGTTACWAVMQVNGRPTCE